MAEAETQQYLTSLLLSDNTSDSDNEYYAPQPQHYLGEGTAGSSSSVKAPRIAGF